MVGNTSAQPRPFLYAKWFPIKNKSLRHLLVSIHRGQNVSYRYGSVILFSQEGGPFVTSMTFTKHQYLWNDLQRISRRNMTFNFGAIMPRTILKNRESVPKVARSRLTQCSKSCDLQPALRCAIRGAQGVLPCVGWGVRPVNWIYRLWCHCS